MSRASSSSHAPCIRSRSDSEPTRVPTTASDTGEGGDVVAELHAVEGYATGAVVGAVTRLGERAAEPGDVEHTAAVRYEARPVQRRPRVEDESSGRLRGLDAVDRRARLHALRAVPRRQDDRHVRLLPRE